MRISAVTLPQIRNAREITLMLLGISQPQRNNSVNSVLMLMWILALVL